MRRLMFGLAAVAACALVADIAAQQPAPPPPGLPTPRINHAFPAGAKHGTTAEVTVTGFDLDDPTGLLFSHPGIKGEYVEPKDPPDPKKDKDKKKRDGGRKKRNPAEPQKFSVTVDAKVPPGTYDVRVVDKWGVSNPRSFVVGELAEVNEKESNNDVPEAQKVEIGTTVNGVIASPTDVDYTVFAGKKGQRVILSCLASAIDSRARPMIEVYDAAGRKLARNRNYRDTDAVVDLTLPADGDYYVRLFEFTYLSGGADHVYRLSISTAPWVDAVFPPAIEFGKPAQVTLYGRNLPNGQPAGFTVDGHPLEKLAVAVTPPTDPLAAQRLTVRDRTDPGQALQDGFEYRLQGPGGTSNPVPVYFTREKAVVKKNQGGTKPETAEAIPTPCEVAGMIHRKGDRDWYSFEAKKGDVLMVEVTAERMGTAADFYFHVYLPPAADKPMAKMTDVSNELDDDNDQQNSSLHPTEFYTRTLDPPAYKFTAPADGKVLVAVGCRESTFLVGPQTAYRLRVGPAKPDFRAVAKPYGKSYQTGSAGRQDSTEAYEVFVHRTDGFTGSVTVTAEGLPAGVTAKPTVIGPAAKWGVLVLDIGPSAAAFTGTIKLKATSTTPDGKPLVREVRPASVTWGVQQGQNIPVMARLSQTLVLAVRPEKGFFKLDADPAKATIKPANSKEKEVKASGPLVVKQGDKITLPVKAKWVGDDKPNLTLAAEPMTQNQQTSPINVQPGGQPTKDKPEVTVTLDVKANAAPGVYAVVLRGDAQVGLIKDPMNKGAKTNVPASAFTDPVEVTVIPTSLAKVKAGQLPNNTVKAGSTAELPVQIDRQYDFAGEFKVTFVPPKGVSGVSAAEVTVPAGTEEAKLVIKAAADAKPGAVNGGLVVVTAVYGGKHKVEHETKVNFNVAAADKKK
jgi:hypothetical protein